MPEPLPAQAWGVPPVIEPRTHGYASTPLGQVLVVIAGGELTGLYFAGHPRTPGVDESVAARGETLSMVRSQLEEYFQGLRKRFDLPIRLQGTPFQVEVWSALLEIPFGRTSTYGQVAGSIGRQRAARAVGAANGRNPISIVVPCHRLLGTQGALTGYGWGLDRKRRLLELEGANRARRSVPATRAGVRPVTAGS
jgi:methylated-DNA-[protein]-cysteine S-methyltransferase